MGTGIRSDQKPNRDTMTSCCSAVPAPLVTRLAQRGGECPGRSPADRLRMTLPSPPGLVGNKPEPRLPEPQAGQRCGQHTRSDARTSSASAFRRPLEQAGASPAPRARCAAPGSIRCGRSGPKEDRAAVRPGSQVPRLPDCTSSTGPPRCWGPSADWGRTAGRGHRTGPAPSGRNLRPCPLPESHGTTCSYTSSSTTPPCCEGLTKVDGHAFPGPGVRRSCSTVSASPWRSTCAPRVRRSVRRPRSSPASTGVRRPG
ncbi:hypothetical protein QFZ74_000350 [Streptomyces sp. V3I7]|nr:hypothetical protein [Streptomyces sp. V3I7]